MPERITLTIETHGDAFDVRPATEIARIMRGVAERVEQGDWDTDDMGVFVVRDIGGRIAGSLRIDKVE